MVERNGSAHLRSGLALGGGGARGLAHVGVLQVLEREGYPFDLVAGTSMGGLIAGLYGLVGSSAALLDLQVHSPSPPATRFSRAPRAEMFESRLFRRWLRDLFGERTFADLHWPTGVTAVDVDSGQEVALNRGPVAPAIWATTAIPGIYTPVMINGRRLVDGGLLDPVPVDLAHRMGAQKVLAVDVLPEVDRPTAALPAARHRALIRKLGVTLDIVYKSFDILTSAQRDYRLRESPPDLLITPDLRGISTVAYHRVEEITERGVAAAEAVLPAIRALRDQILAGDAGRAAGVEGGARAAHGEARA